MFDKNFKNEPVEIKGEKVDLGEHKLIKFEIDRLATGTKIEIPTYVFNGKLPGPTVLVQAGLHGDELNGVEIVRKMLTKNHFDVEKGCVIVVPLLNVFGFLHFSRDVHDKDVNRSFPGSKTGSLASRIAYFHLREITKNVDFGIDIHTGGKQRSNYPQVRYTPGSDEGKQLATVFNAPYQFASNLISKSFRKAAHQHNIPIIVYEAGESLRFNKFAIRKGIEGIKNVLEYFEMTAKDEEKEVAKTIEITSRRWIRARIAGMLNLRIKNGEVVTKGQILGYITDTYGESTLSVKAPYDGYIIALNNFPVVNRGDAIFHIGKE
ncbi:succinylglutamate desuccinylase/aspartoacylase family protein [Aureibaculum sp. 2210JD6-5]|uniref:succinylglutamate desuccinylase/aspartoacylase family protein n=1 Tax=Aureibaculum sp. 2210JD6-5 TaxID=3103957 RepID=UPI002AAE36EA|nr:succinylglutamate desuccinylase/aspartoacylase family protein [Aureibaculum sp. 2210JD6-5]MDY7395694.1 succinylglutamate desuccinylase/aspartoacylase family protein [Aureibaculum sp. 2210JD6-5]